MSYGDCEIPTFWNVTEPKARKAVEAAERVRRQARRRKEDDKK